MAPQKTNSVGKEYSIFICLALKATELRTERQRDVYGHKLMSVAVVFRSTSKRTKGNAFSFGGKDGLMLGRRGWFDAVSKCFSAVLPVGLLVQLALCCLEANVLILILGRPWKTSLKIIILLSLCLAHERSFNGR